MIEISIPQIAVLTPMYNEERNVERMLLSVVSQDLPPAKILIGDNESTDRTVQIARKVLCENGFDFDILTVHRYPRFGKRNISNVYWYLSKLLARQCKRLDYVAIVEADVVLERSYFRKIISFFEKDIKLGIACGRLEPLGLPSDSYPLIGRPAMLWGSNRVYRASCWHELASMVDLRQLIAWDTDHVLLALMRGYHVKQMEDAISWCLRLETRPFRGEQKGSMDALHGLPVWWVLAKTVQKKDPLYLCGFMANTILAIIKGLSLDNTMNTLRRIYRAAAVEDLRRAIRAVI